MKPTTAVFTPRFIRRSLVLCATLLIPTMPIQAASVSDIPERSPFLSNGKDTVKFLLNEESEGGVIRSDQHFSGNGLGVDWTPIHEKREGIGKHGKTNKRETRHDDDNAPWFSGHDGDFSFHEKTWRGSKCDTSPVPAPSAAWLLISGLIGLFAAARGKPGDVSRPSVG